MEKLDWKKTIRFNILALKIVGLWPKEGESYGHNLYTFYMVISIFMFQVSHIFSQTVNLYFIRTDLEAVIGTIFILLTEFGATLKTYCVINNMKTLKSLMVTLNSDMFQPKNSHQRELIQPNLKAWTVIFSVFWFFAFFCLLFWAVFPLMDKTYKEYRLPFLAWYPFDTKASPQYEITYLYQATAVTFTAIANINTDMLIAALNMYIGAQFDLLCDNVRNLYQSGKDTAEDVEKKLKENIRHHWEILNFADEANRFYRWIIFVQFFVSAVSIGLSMFRLTVCKPFSGEFYSLVSYINGLLTQIFMYCWFSEEIVVKSKKLPYAIFESDWVYLSVATKKNLIFFILRVQKSLKVSAVGLFYLSLETFVKIIRTAFSYFTLLQQVNTPT